MIKVAVLAKCLKQVLGTVRMFHLAHLLPGRFHHARRVELLEHVKGLAQVNGQLLVVIVQVEE